VGLLAALATGCSSVKYVRELPPVDLLRPCPAPTEQFKTNGELVKTLLAYRKALGDCNIDKESLREWAKENE
jgi:hypothetical protein